MTIWGHTCLFKRQVVKLCLIAISDFFLLIIVLLVHLCFHLSHNQVLPGTRNLKTYRGEKLLNKQFISIYLMWILGKDHHDFYLCYFIFFITFFFFFTATPSASGGSQARDWIGVATSGLHHSYSNARSKPHMRTLPQLATMPGLDLLSRARDRISILMDTLMCS